MKITQVLDNIRALINKLGTLPEFVCVVHNLYPTKDQLT